MSKIQSILIPRTSFTLQEANKWIKDHNFKLKFKNKRVHITQRFYRYRQHEPNPKLQYFVKKIP